MSRSEKRQMYLAVIVGTVLLSIFWQEVLSPHTFRSYSWVLVVCPVILAFPARRSTLLPDISTTDTSVRRGPVGGRRRVSSCEVVLLGGGLLSLAGLVLGPQAASSSFTWLLLVSGGGLALRAGILARLSSRRWRRSGGF